MRQRLGAYPIRPCRATPSHILIFIMSPFFKYMTHSSHPVGYLSLPITDSHPTDLKTNISKANAQVPDPPLRDTRTPPVRSINS